MRYGFFYRVEDEGSQAVTVLGQGITAAGKQSINLSAKFGLDGRVLWENLEQHLDWNSDHKSPFISTYDNEDVAFDIACGRKRLGKKRVSITVIDVSKVYGQVEFREMRRLVWSLDGWIQEEAYNNSKHEWVFLHHIPDEAIVDFYHV